MLQSIERLFELRERREGNDPATMRGMFPPEEPALRNPLPILPTPRIVHVPAANAPGATHTAAPTARAVPALPIRPGQTPTVAHTTRTPPPPPPPPPPTAPPLRLPPRVPHCRGCVQPRRHHCRACAQRRRHLCRLRR